jgi:hypothetical protein
MINMNKEIYTSDRYFAIYGYMVSHGQLLLRSDKIKGYETNIDVVFFDTTYVQLLTRLEGISIRILSENSEVNYESVRKYLSYDNSHLFEIRSNNEKYIIAASFVRVFENDLEFNELSIGFDGKGREIEIASSVSFVLGET